MHKVAAISERAAQIFAALAAFIFLVSGLVYLWFGRWTVTNGDFWRIYDICLNHTWLESALLKYNMHSLFFPSFLWLADLRFFHGNQELLFVAGLLLLFLTVALLLIPVWRDETVGLTAKITATLVIFVGNFWMARAPITTSGGYNSICSLVTASAVFAVLMVVIGCRKSSQISLAIVIVLCSAFVASFSFGTGLAIWPTLLFTFWCLRLSWRFFVPLGIAAAAAMLIYQALPPHSTDYNLTQDLGSAGAALVSQLCRLAGSPFFYAASGWQHHNPTSAQAAQSSLLSLWCGAAGLTLAVIAIVLTMIRRDLAKSSMRLIGMTLVTFNLVAMAIIVAGRVSHFRTLPSAVAAPRYLFWSTLFWTGLLLIGIQHAEPRQWLRWPVYLAVLGLPVLVFPMHYRSGLNSRWAQMLSQSGATSLINRVRDDQQTFLLAPLAGVANEVYHLAEELDARRLDMFAAGLQDWLGVSETSISRGRYQREGLSGQCKVAALVRCDNGAPAARVTGQLWKSSQRVPKTLVIVDPAGVVRGIGRSSSMFNENRLVNTVFYLRKVTESRFVGYIRDYNPQLQYAVRSADHRILSTETVPVEVPMAKSTKP